MALETAIDKPNAPPMKTDPKNTQTDRQTNGQMDRNTPVDRFTIHLYFIRHSYKYSFLSLSIKPTVHFVVSKVINFLKALRLLLNKRFAHKTRLIYVLGSWIGKPSRTMNC